MASGCLNVGFIPGSPGSLLFSKSLVARAWEEGYLTVSIDCGALPPNYGGVRSKGKHNIVMLIRYAIPDIAMTTTIAMVTSGVLLMFVLYNIILIDLSTPSVGH